MGNQLKQKLTRLKKEIELNPEDANAHRNLGALLYEQNKLEEAEKEYRKAIEINPEDAEAYCNLGILLSKIGKSKEAKKELKIGTGEEQAKESMLTAKDMMIKDPLYCGPMDNIHYVKKLMYKYKIGHMPVVNEGKKVVGVVALKDLDIYHLALTGGLGGLKTTCIKDVMISGPWTAKEYVKFNEILNLMVEKRVKGLPVVNDNMELVGFICRREVLRGMIRTVSG